MTAAGLSVFVLVDGNSRSVQVFATREAAERELRRLDAEWGGALMILGPVVVQGVSKPAMLKRRG